MIRYLSDNIVRLIAPINVQPSSSTPVSSGTCILRLFDAAHETALTASGTASQTVLPVYRARSIKVGSSVVVSLSDGTYHAAGAVTARDLEADTITVTTGLASSAARDARVLTQLGQSITCSTYGTPNLSTTTWGFYGVIQAEHNQLVPGQSIRMEIHLDESGLELLEVIRDTVVVGF